jgi:hypothetical protein
MKESKESIGSVRKSAYVKLLCAKRNLRTGVTSSRALDGRAETIEKIASVLPANRLFGDRAL